MITLTNVTKEFGDKTLFGDVNLTIYDGERVGIVGENGSGKTTLANVIAGVLKPDSGKVVIDGTIAYMKQATDYTQEDFKNIFYSSQSSSEFLQFVGLLNLDKNIDFESEQLASLSGGEKTKLMLAYVLSKNPEILIMDEPTNHMDREGIDWMISAISSFFGTVLVVSHDRFFLNKVANRIIEIENGSLSDFYGTYDEFVEDKGRRKLEQKRKVEEQVALERKIDKQISALNSWANKAESESRRQGGMRSDSKIKGAQTKAQVHAAKLASQAKAKVSKLEHAKLSFIKRPYEEGTVHYRIESKPVDTKVLIRVENVSKSFGDKIIFSNANFTINAGEKVSLVGRNGCGKTTLLKMILGEDNDYSGLIWTTPSLKCAYLSQDVFNLDEDKTVMEIASSFDKEYKTLFLSNLINMNMARQVFQRKIKTLSLGERMRIKMCEVILSDFNLLILDEPTNHLDLPNKIFLEKILKDYKGSLILVSHDRALCTEVCNNEIIFKDNTLRKQSLDR